MLGTSATRRPSFLRGTTGLGSACVTAAVQGERWDVDSISRSRRSHRCYVPCVMSLGKWWKRRLQARGFSSVIHNQPESGSASGVRRGRRINENITHARGRMASSLKRKVTVAWATARVEAPCSRDPPVPGTNTARSHLRGVPGQSHAETKRTVGPRAGRGSGELVFNEQRVQVCGVQRAPETTAARQCGRPPHTGPCGCATVWASPQHWAVRLEATVTAMLCVPHHNLKRIKTEHHECRERGFGPGTFPVKEGGERGGVAGWRVTEGRRAGSRD